MKFKKFMKELGVNGRILTNGDDRWLVGESVAMLIPKEVNVVLANSQTEAPDWFKDVIDNDIESNLCKLKKALILDAEGKANSIIRVFETDDGETSIGIKNPYYALLEKDDVLNIYLPNRLHNDGTRVLRVIAYEEYKPKIVGFICEYKYKNDEM